MRYEYAAQTAAAAVASTTSNTFVATGTGAHIYLDVTATPNNSETLTLSVQAFDAQTGKYVTYTGFTALTASGIGATSTTSTYVYTIYPGATETGTVANHEGQSLPLPTRFRIKGTHSSSGAWSYTVGVSEF